MRKQKNYILLKLKSVGYYFTSEQFGDMKVVGSETLM